MTFSYVHNKHCFIAECDALLPPERLGGRARRCRRGAIIAAEKSQQAAVMRDLAAGDHFFFRKSGDAVLAMCGPCRAAKLRARAAAALDKRAARKRASARAENFRNSPPPEV
jgi:hypothetical protein